MSGHFADSRMRMSGKVRTSSCLELQRHLVKTALSNASRVLEDGSASASKGRIACRLLDMSLRADRIPQQERPLSFLCELLTRDTISSYTKV